MNRQPCDPTTHAYRPLPDSSGLFCTRCGDMVFCETVQWDRPAPNRDKRSLVEHIKTLCALYEAGDIHISVRFPGLILEAHPVEALFTYTGSTNQPGLYLIMGNMNAETPNQHQ